MPRSAAAANFGIAEQPDRTTRYRRASEFIDVVQGLWTGAVNGSPVHHRGEFFQVDGRLPLGPSPQGHPLLVQAGGSPQGRELAGRTADGAFTAELTLDAGIEHYETRPYTFREVLDEFGNGGHRRIVGSPEDVADTLEEWFRAGAADGFNLMPDAFPSGLDDFVDHVVPVLRRRGLFRREYAEPTLRRRWTPLGTSADHAA